MRTQAHSRPGAHPRPNRAAKQGARMGAAARGPEESAEKSAYEQLQEIGIRGDLTMLAKGPRLPSPEQVLDYALARIGVNRRTNKLY